MKKRKKSNRYSPETRALGVRVVPENQGSYGNALAEMIKRLYNTEAIHRRISWGIADEVELATSHELIGSTIACLADWNLPTRSGREGLPCKREHTRYGHLARGIWIAANPAGFNWLKSTSANLSYCIHLRLSEEGHPLS